MNGGKQKMIKLFLILLNRAQDRSVSADANAKIGMVRVENPVEIFQYYLFKIRFKFSGIPVKTGKTVNFNSISPWVL